MLRASRAGRPPVLVVVGLLAVVAAGLVPAAAARGSTPGPGVDIGVRAPADTLEWPDLPAIERSVREAVAREWAVDAEALTLEWGPAGSAPPPAPGARVSVSGSGAGGHFLVDLSPPGNGGSTVRRRVRVAQDVARRVAARRLERGDVLREEDMLEVAWRVWGPVSAVGGAEDAHSRVEPGWIVRRLLQEGEPLEPPAVSAPPLVESGDQVEIVWSRGPISIRVHGRAQGSGALGETVQVRTESGRRLKAVVQSRGVVSLGEPDGGAR